MEIQSAVFDSLSAGRNDQTITKHKDRTLDKQNPSHHQFKNYCGNIMHQHEQQ